MGFTPPKADMLTVGIDVCFVPIADVAGRTTGQCGLVQMHSAKRSVPERQRPKLVPALLVHGLHSGTHDRG
jgi:hypothetical protein